MNRLMNSMLKRNTGRGLLVAVCIISLAMQSFTAGRCCCYHNLNGVVDRRWPFCGQRQRRSGRPDRH